MSQTILEDKEGQISELENNYSSNYQDLESKNVKLASDANDKIRSLEEIVNIGRDVI